MKSRSVSERIDKLTNSIEVVATGKSEPTEFYRLTLKHAIEIKAKNWRFDWKKEISDGTNEVYKMTTKANSTIIQGLISLRKEKGFIYMALVESAKFNRGAKKLHQGVLGNMVAFACKRAEIEGFRGWVSFVSKSALIEHYKEVLGAKVVFNNTMEIQPLEAQVLINKYFNT